MSDVDDHDPQDSAYAGDAVMVMTCPGCSGHLQDTWTGERCGRCGFQYLVTPPDTTTATPDRTRPPSLRRQQLSIALAGIGMLTVIVATSVLMPTPDLTQDGALVLGDAFRQHIQRSFWPVVAQGIGLLLIYTGGALGGGRSD